MAAALKLIAGTAGAYSADAAGYTTAGGPMVDAAGPESGTFCSDL